MSEQRELRRGEVRYTQEVRDVHVTPYTTTQQLIGARHEVYDGTEWVDVRRLLDAEARAQAAEAKVARVREHADTYAFLGATLHDVPRAETWAEAADDLRRIVDGDA